jgi:hypothetical protein
MVRLWDAQQGTLKASVLRDDAPRLHPDWIAARRSAPTASGYVAWAAARRIGISANLVNGAVAALWDADGDVRLLHLESSGLLAIAIAGRPLEFLALFYGNRRISLAELPSPRARACVAEQPVTDTSAKESPATPMGNDKGGWVPLLDHVPERLAELFTSRGFEKAKEGRLELGLTDFNQALRLHPERKDALLYRARAYLQLQGQTSPDIPGLAAQSLRFGSRMLAGVIQSFF